ncbi:MAG: thiamine diphosphokinase [Clostridiales bacterium]|jgi:thiamine pyrophosphokinase|nr:thiamine diphosphokinase [Clostridiales bacterium]
MKTAALILNGLYVPRKISADYVVCADGGYNLALSRGIVPDIVIGDNDSIKDFSSASSGGGASGVKRLNFNPDKDMTDGELALRHIIADEGYKNVVIYGALGGREDHVQSNLALSALAAALGAKAVIEDEETEIHYIDKNFNKLSLKLPLNILISIVPFCSFAHIISTKGLKYPIADKRLNKISSLGVSNLSVEESVEICILRGSALVFVNYAR